jgi:hypothetical protein
MLSNGFSREVAAHWEELKRKLRNRSSGVSGGRPKKLLPNCFFSEIPSPKTRPGTVERVAEGPTLAF